MKLPVNLSAVKAFVIKHCNADAMKQHWNYWAASGLFVVLLISLLVKSGSNQVVVYDSAYDEYLSAFTSGEISRKSKIRLRFSQDVVSTTDAAIEDDVLGISPRLKGKAKWLDTRTIEFDPDTDLEPGKLYTAQVNMKPFFKNIPKKLDEFKFQFKAKPRHVNMSPLMLTSSNSDNVKYASMAGQVVTNDTEENQMVEEMVDVRVDGKELIVRWEHNEEGTIHRYTVDSLKRGANPYALLVNWSGKPLDISDRGELKGEIPAASDFSYRGATRHIQGTDKYILLEFSDPIDKSQQLEGLIQVRGDGVGTAYFSVEDNKIKVFIDKNFSGKATVIINKGIKNTEGEQLGDTKTSIVEFPENTKPTVKLIGKGVIMPRGEKLPFTFEACALNAIDVRIIKIHENNIPQFLQINSLEGNEELYRVGKQVLRKKIMLDKVEGLDLKQWNTHAIDLAPLINPEPGAIYEIALGFKKSYAILEKCPDPEVEKDEEGNDLPPAGEKENDMLELSYEWAVAEEGGRVHYWDYWGYDDDYEPNAPCSQAYYGWGRSVRKNVMTSDLGVICKSGADGTFLAVTDLKTTKPMSNVTLELFDFQNQLILETKTDKNGQIFLQLERKPFLVIAKDREQRGYLRLADGDALMTSKYDVGGTTFHKGIKGFIYGERGVWRPGDDMFINFILEDKAKTLPENHPVTFELIGPRGQLVERSVKTDGKNGFFNFTTKTPSNAFTGNYIARVRVGGAIFEKTLKVETILPNRLKVGLDFGKNYIEGGNAKMVGTLSSTWLHGAVARGLKADVTVNLKAAGSATFPNYKDYSFWDPSSNFNVDEVKLFEGNLSDDGKAKVPVKLNINGRPGGVLDANFKCRVFEVGGAFSTDRFNIPYHHYNRYVGTQLPPSKGSLVFVTDKEHAIDVVLVSPDGKPVANQKLNASFKKLVWRWWFDYSYRDYSYSGENSAEELDSEEIVTDANGKATFKVKVNHPEYGRYLVKVCDGEGHCSAQEMYIDWPNWADRMGDGEDMGPAYLNFSADKKDYNVGENINLSIPTPHQGRALVTLENSVKVLSAHWVDCTAGMTTFSIPATAEMTPNAYVTVSLLQPHAQTINDLPMRMYGIVPVNVANPSTKIEPVIAMADKLQPNKEFSVKVSEKRGGPMTYTIAVVDEGLLGLTRFKTPSPWDYFYQREALGVKTWDLYDKVVGMYKGDIRSLLSIGGDGEIVSTNKPDRFKPVVMYAGPFTIEKGQNKEHKFKMPNYFGEVRVMVVAANQNAYGNAEKSVPVREPLMALATLPRLVSPGDRFDLPVTVFAMEEHIKNATITVQTNDMMGVDVGGNTRTMQFNQIGDQNTFFSVKVKDRIGKGHVKVTATSGNYTSVYETDIEVRVPNPTVNNVASSQIEKGQNHTFDYKPIGLTGTNKAYLEVSSLPPMNITKRMNYLIRYPYGCLEQTTSAAFPQLYVGRFMELGEREKAMVETHVKHGIDRLRNFQCGSGGFGYWRSNDAENEWGTNYVGHFLLEAKSLGYAVPEDVLTKWKKYQSSMANNYVQKEIHHNSDLVQAYRLFTLSLAGAPEIGAMNRMRSNDKTTLTAKWLLAGAYHLAGKKDVAERITDKLQTLVAKYSELTYTYGNEHRDEGLILYMLSLMNRKTEAAAVLEKIAARLGSESWYSTHVTSVSLIGISKYIGDNTSPSKLDFNWAIKGGAPQSVKIGKGVVQISLDGDNSQSIVVTSSNQSTIWARVISEGVPLQGDMSTASNGLKLSVSYWDGKGNQLDPAKIEQGKDFAAYVTIENPSKYDYYNLALEQIFPAGWEITNTRLDGNGISADVDFQDFRDDRVYSFFRLGNQKSIKVKVLLTAAYMGKFYMPSVTCEAMYDHTINARTGGKWVEVVKKVEN